MKKLAVFFPGIGYTADKPLLYYSRKLAAELDYEEDGGVISIKRATIASLIGNS